MKLSIIKVGFCLAGQPSIITKSKKKLPWQSFMDGKQSRKMKTPSDCLLSRTVACMNNLLKQFLVSLHE